MKVHYLVQAHYLPDCFGALAFALSASRSRIYAHIDAKVDSAPFRDSVEGLDIAFVPDACRVRVNWAGWSQIEATLAMIHLAMDSVEEDDYIILVSGDTYPLAGQESIYAFLDQNAGHQFINGIEMPAVHKPLERISQIHLEYDRRDGRRHAIARGVNRLGIPQDYQRALGGRKPFGGTQWWGLTGASMPWILKAVVEDSRFVRLARRSLVPDEWFFQTLLFNSDFIQYVKPALMFTDWSRPGPKPARIDGEHLRMLAESNLRPKDEWGGQRLFARKVVDSATRSQISLQLWPLAGNLWS